MIVRIIGEGDWEVSRDALEATNPLDRLIESAVNEGDELRFSRALAQLQERVRTRGRPVPYRPLFDPDVTLPPVGASLDAVRHWLEDQPEEDGLVPD